MAETLLFEIPAPGNAELAAERLNWYDSVDGEFWGTPLGTIYISELDTDPVSGKYVWTVNEADPMKFHTIRTVSSNGTENIMSPVIPPRYTATLCEIYADLRDFGMTPVAGVRIKMENDRKAHESSVVVNKQHTFETDATGIARTNVLSGLKVTLSSSIIGSSIEIDTTGKTFVNIADYLGV